MPATLSFDSRTMNMRPRAATALVIALAAASAAGVFATHWFSADERLKRACQGLTWDQLVAPATAQLVAFSIVKSPEQSVVRSGLMREVAAANAEVTKVEAELADLAKKRDDVIAMKVPEEPPPGVDRKTFLSRSIVFSEKKIAALSRIAGAEAEGKKLQTEVERIAAEKAAAVDEFDSKGDGEVVLTLDTQNRSGALIRMHAACVFDRAGEVERQVATMRVVTLAEGKP